MSAKSPIELSDSRLKREQLSFGKKVTGNKQDIKRDIALKTHEIGLKMRKYRSDFGMAKSHGGVDS